MLLVASGVASGATRLRSSSWGAEPVISDMPLEMLLSFDLNLTVNLFSLMKHIAHSLRRRASNRR